MVPSLGPGKTTLLLKAVDAVELEDNRDGVIHVLQARLARKTLVKLRDRGFVKYTVVLPSSHHNRGACSPLGQIQSSWCWLTGLRAQFLWLPHKG